MKEGLVMAICSECKTEYQNDLGGCPYCGVTHANELPVEMVTKGGESPEQTVWDDPTNSKQAILPRLLISTSEIVQANLIESLLKQADVAFFAKDSRNGAYIKAYTGNAFFGKDYYVDAKDYDKAKELIDGYLADAGVNIPADSGDAGETGNIVDTVGTAETGNMGNAGENGRIWDKDPIGIVKEDKPDTLEKPAPNLFKGLMRMLVALMLIIFGVFLVYSIILLLLQLFRFR